ncbi:hypothetical protein TTHERM_00042740 (macronuclear) [Tetrahymena thermophila SB210]|uniref:Uncharacterized protein n=1 Tax=Tetrahymena thermophila (strain SB210) TaxID=312017 RepID=Q22LU2_TETTS|nr:hypothetical protein TTHERM_00042740 [Tetrahymena thermophila SB210]EAR86519.2 hypothetical protein TTHERM_00042740 [Tetrahymena thermophila SB210]|eukprot:XP_977278.2 hypothetical protein TTHERM_00042740 [Tetrahymena thermophila SB210]
MQPIIRMNQKQELQRDQQNVMQQSSQNFYQMYNGQYQQQNYHSYTFQNQYARQQFQPQPSIIYYSYPVLYNPIQYCTSRMYANQQVCYPEQNICNDFQSNLQTGTQHIDSQNEMKTFIQSQKDSRYNFMCEATQQEQKTIGLKINYEQEDQIGQKKQNFQIDQRQNEVFSKDETNQLTQKAKYNDFICKDNEHFSNNVFDDKQQNFRYDAANYTNNDRQLQKQKKQLKQQQSVKIIIKDEQKLIKSNLKKEFSTKEEQDAKDEQQNTIYNRQISQQQLMSSKQSINSSQEKVSIYNKFEKSDEDDQDNQEIQKVQGQSTLFTQRDDLDQSKSYQINSYNYENFQLNGSQQNQASPKLQLSIKNNKKESKIFKLSYQIENLERGEKDKSINEFFKHKLQKTNTIKEDLEHSNKIFLEKDEFVEQEISNDSNDYSNHYYIDAKDNSGHQASLTQSKKVFKSMKEKRDATNQILSKQIDKHINDQKQNLMDQISIEERDIVKQALQINRQNANKNIVKAFQKSVNETLTHTFEYKKKDSSSYYYKICKDEEVIRNENPTQLEKIQFLKKFNKFISTKSYTNLHIQQIISNRIYGQILFKEFLQHQSFEWLEKANVSNKNQYSLILNFYKMCCANIQLLDFLNDINIIQKSGRLSKFQKNSQKSLQKSCETQICDNESEHLQIDNCI